MARPSVERGFTLLELIVAIAIFALVSVIAFSGLQTTLTTRDLVQAQAERLIELQRAFMLMQQDISQATDRGIRDRFGDVRGPMLLEVDGLEWTRGGAPNPAGLPRSALQRVGYTLEDGALLRRQWQALDQPYDPVVRSRALLQDVEALEFRFLSDDKQWLETWPPAGTGGLPRAIEVRLRLTDLGEVHRMFLLAF